MSKLSRIAVLLIGAFLAGAGGAEKGLSQGRSVKDLLPGSWKYARVMGAPKKAEYLLSLTLQESEQRGGELRFLLDYAGPGSFCCVSLKDGIVRFLKFEERLVLIDLF